MNILPKKRYVCIIYIRLDIEMMQYDICTKFQPVKLNFKFGFGNLV